MTELSRTPAQTKSTRGSANGDARSMLLDYPKALRDKAERTVTDVAHTLRDTADKQSKVAKRQARKLYRTSSPAIKRNPWRTVGIALLTGIVAGSLIAMSRRSE